MSPHLMLSSHTTALFCLQKEAAKPAKAWRKNNAKNNPQPNHHADQPHDKPG
jgi:hypothetical protein